MAVPKRKTSKAKRDSRRAPNMRVASPSLATCSHCHSPKLPHRVCPVCGWYGGKQIVDEE